MLRVFFFKKHNLNFFFIQNGTFHLATRDQTDAAAALEQAEPYILAIVVITMGEMIIMPTSQALAANFAPVEMCGRYMAVYGLCWIIPAMFGPGAAGYILDNYNPNLLWYVGGALCIVSAFSFYGLHLRIGSQKRFAAKPEEELPVEQTI